MVAVDGGDELRSVAACEKQRRGGGARRVREGARGCVAMLEGPWRHGGSRRWTGKQEVAEAASAPVGHARCLLARGRRQEGSPWWAGPASAAGRTGEWASGKSQVSSFSLF